MANTNRRRFRNQFFTVTGKVNVLGRRLELLAPVQDGLNLSTAHMPARSDRWVVFDPKAGPHGDIRQVYRFGFSKDHRQYLGALSRATTQNRQFPQIVQYEQEGRYTVVVTTWIHGRPFEGYFDSVTSPQKRPSVDQMFRLYNGLCHGLCHLHSRAGVIHGDVHPGNLILAAEPSNHLALVDFGSAWKFEQTTSRAAGDGHARGYEAPELIFEDRTAKASERSDQFSAAVVFYEMLTGKLPYAEMGGRIIKQYGLDRIAEAQKEYVPPSQLLRSAWYRPPARILSLIDEVIAPSLRLNPDERYSGKGSWLNALQKLDVAIKTEPELGVVARRVLSAIGRTASFFKRN